METISIFFKQSIPHYFEGLPIPSSFKGWFHLSIKDWLSLVPLGVAIGGVGYMSYYTFCPRAKGRNIINPHIHKEKTKHVDIVDIENLGEETSLCRCWRSSKFPYCDGTHNQFNEAVGDNVGPVVLKKNK